MLIILKLILSLFFLIAGIILMSIWGLIASGSGALILSIYIFLNPVLKIRCIKERWINTTLKRRIVLGVLIAIVTLTMIVLLSIFDDFTNAVLEIATFIIYLFILYAVVNLVQQYMLNRKLMKNQIYVYTQKLVPMLKFQSTGSGAQGKMIENNREVLFFFLSSTQFM